MMSTSRNNIPPQTSLSSTLAKSCIGLVLGSMLGFVFFFLLSMVGKSLNVLVAMGDVGMGVTGGGSNPLLSILLLIVTLVSTFAGVSIMVTIYSMLFGEEYYDFGAMFRYSLLTNIVIFIFLIPVYLIYMSNMSTLFFVMALHIALAVYVCSMQLEMMINPHYSISASIGATLGLVTSMLVYTMVIAMLPKGNIQAHLHRYVIVPPVLIYSLIPFGIGVWKILYSKLYESGTDILYLASPSDNLSEAEEQQEEINVNR